MTGQGRVAIIGAGPGDPALITVRGLERLRRAQVLIYDRLVAGELVDLAPAGSERIFAGKAAGCAHLGQREIEAVMIDRARAGLFVVRLKGGDPFVFGRGGEELAALRSAGIAVEVVPGVTSATAAPAAVGIPVTQRGLSSSLTIVTGHEDPGKLVGDVDWRWLAQASGTLVILMGLRRLRAITELLLAGGLAPDVPAAAIASGTLPAQRAVAAPLAALPDAVDAARLGSPLLIVVGEVVRMADASTDLLRSVPLPAELLAGLTAGSRDD